MKITNIDTKTYIINLYVQAFFLLTKNINNLLTYDLTHFDKIVEEFNSSCLYIITFVKLKLPQVADIADIEFNAVVGDEAGALSMTFLDLVFPAGRCHFVQLCVRVKKIVFPIWNESKATFTLNRFVCQILPILG